MNFNFDDFYNDYFNKIQRYVFNILHDEDDTFDVIQDVFIKMEKIVPKLETQKDVSSYTYKVAYNTAISKYRKNKVFNKIFWFTNHEDHDSDESYAHYDKDYEMENKIKQIFKKLDKKSKTVMYLKYFESMSSKEIAGIINTSFANVDMIHSRALKKLRLEEV